MEAMIAISTSTRSAIALNSSRTLTAFDEKGNREYFRRNFAPFNILTELENNYLDLKVIDLRLQGSLNYKITPDITV